MSDERRTLMVSEILRIGRGGLVDVEASDMLSEIVKAVRETGKKGTLTLKLSVEVNGDNGIAIRVSPSSTKPKSDLGTILMFDDGDGGLQRTDPRQEELYAGPRAAYDGRNTPRMIRDELAAEKASNNA